MVNYMAKRKIKKGRVFFIIIIFSIIGLFIYDYFWNGSSYSNKIGALFDEAIGNVTDNTEAYQTCMSEEVLSEEDFSDELIAKRDEIISLYSSVNADFMYTDLESGYSFGEGEDNQTYAASVTKLPTVLYVYKEADEGNIDLDKELTYTSEYTAGGSGIIQNEAVGTVYTLRTLLEYAIKYSDNIAYYMILDEIGGTSVIQNYYANLGINIVYSDRFGYLSPSLGNDYIKEVYEYYLTGTENAEKLVEDMINSDNSEYVQVDGVDVAHKYGEYVEGGGYYNDVSLNLTAHPFALSITSTLGLTDTMETLFLETHELAVEFNELYYEEKSAYCMENY